MLKRVLNDFARVEGVNSAAIVDRAGFVIEGVSKSHMDLDEMGAMSTTALGTADAMVAELGRSNVKTLSIEVENGIILIAAVTEYELVVVIGNQNANVGRIRYEIGKSRGKFKEILVS